MTTGQQLGARPYFQPIRTPQGWRIVKSQNGEDRDICGAANEEVAWETCRQMNLYREAHP